MGSIAEMAVTDQTLDLDLDGALDQARTRYAEQNPRSNVAFKETLPYMPGANTRTVLHAQPFPLTFSGGKGATLTTVDGDTYIDFLGEYSAGIYGHSCEEIKRAIRETTDKGWNLGGKNEGEATLSRIVVERFSNSLEAVRFCNSGTEANLMAIGAAVNFTGKLKVRMQIPTALWHATGLR
jgi:glutamate-1-semialdehyde 2,1-aminomutase